MIGFRCGDRGGLIACWCGESDHYLQGEQARVLRHEAGGGGHGGALLQRCQGAKVPRCQGAKVPRCVVDSSALQCHPMLGAML